MDLENPPPLTPSQQAELSALRDLGDKDVDVSDISLLTEAFWRNAVPNPFFKPRKSSTTIRIDADVLAWLRAQGRGYQSRINAILRKEMLSSLKRGV